MVRTSESTETESRLVFAEMGVGLAGEGVSRNRESAGVSFCSDKKQSKIVSVGGGPSPGTLTQMLVVCELEPHKTVLKHVRQALSSLCFRSWLLPPSESWPGLPHSLRAPTVL